MEETFVNLMQRSNQTKAIVTGNPWQVLPIKNFKNARECTEVYLGKQQLQSVSEFEHFPNIEVLWLNNNLLESLENLDKNYKIKHLYLQYNKIKTIKNGSLKYMKHLETLVLSDNELRGLDDTIEFIKQFRNIKYLDFTGNPLCEEPNYRIKMIYNLPWIQLLDKHNLERIKAHKFFNETQKIPKKKQHRLSESEKQLFATAKQIILTKAEQEIIRKQEEKDLIEKQFQVKLSKTLPKPTIVWEVEKGLQGPESMVTEWEKNKIKTVFKSLDIDKKRMLNKNQMEILFEKLSQDQQNIGKVPACELSEFLQKTIQSNETMVWDDFRMVMNKFFWKKQDINLLNQKINEKFAEAQKLQNMGRIQQAFQTLFTASKLQNTLNYEDKEKLYQTKKNVTTICRRNFFDFSKYKDFNQQKIYW